MLGKSDGDPCRSGPDQSIGGDKYAVCSNTNWDTIFHSVKVKAPAVPRPLTLDPNPPPITWTLDAAGPVLSVDDFLDRQPVMGMLILQGDRIVVEKYQYERKPDQKFTSFSMAKTLTGFLVGAALKDGAIASLDDPAAKYVPALKGTAYEGIALRNLLHMASGVKWDEGPSIMMGSAVVRRFTDATLRRKGPGGVYALNWLTETDVPQGTRFNYAGPDTQVLGLVVRAATGKSLADYASEKLWKPMGAEADASWAVDYSGAEVAYTSFNARLRDYGRLGLFLAEGLKRGDDSVVSDEFMNDATRAERQPAYTKVRIVSRRYYGYGYQTWILPYKSRTFALIGSYGQRVVVQPDSHIVIVYTSAQRTQSVQPGPFREEIAFIEGVIRSLGGNIEAL